MIRPEEIDDAIVRDLALFISTNGAMGKAPAWYKLFVLASRCNAPVWEVERILASTDSTMTCAGKREWVVRAAIVEFANAEAGRQMSRPRPVPLVQPARRIG